MIRCCITDRHVIGGTPPDVVALVARAWLAGAQWVQVREKDLTGRALCELVRSVLAVPRPADCRVLVNTRLDVALAAGAHGVHLPSQSPAPSWLRPLTPPGFLIGASCHTEADVRCAGRDGADYVFFSPIFSVPGKGSPVGLDGLRRAVQATQLPVIALGGITSDHISACEEAGAAGVAGIRLFT